VRPGPPLPRILLQSQFRTVTAGYSVKLGTTPAICSKTKEVSMKVSQKEGSKEGKNNGMT